MLVDEKRCVADCTFGDYWLVAVALPSWWDGDVYTCENKIRFSFLVHCSPLHHLICDVITRVNDTFHMKNVIRLRAQTFDGFRLGPLSPYHNNNNNNNC